MTHYPIPINEEYTFTAEKSVTVTGEETLLLSVDEKEQLLLALQRLLLSGVKQAFFTGPLYRFLIHYCHFSAELTQVLQDLEVKHEEMIAAWHTFAVAANITDVALPPTYQISENTRHLLAHAATIALRHQRPLTGLWLDDALVELILAEAGE